MFEIKTLLYINYEWRVCNFMLQYNMYILFVKCILNLRDFLCLIVKLFHKKLYSVNNYYAH